ncbi:MAG: hypothetical protein OHK006_13210 [Thermodesulfovibrionales bacterium]
MGEVGIYEGERQKWIQYDEDTEVLIRLISKEELRKILIKAQKSAKLTGSHADNYADQLLGRAAVKGWRKIDRHEHPGLTVGGKPLPFTPENIDLLMKGSLKFSRFVNDSAVAEDEFADGAEDEKNV